MTDGGYYWGDFVIPTTFVQASDVAAWMFMDDPSGLPATISAIIRSCTVLVLKATQGAFYDADPDTGLPTDTTALQAMKDATCVQAAAWVQLGIDPFLGGVLEGGEVQTSSKLGSASVGYADAAAATAARAAARTHLVPEAAAMLQQRDLLGTNVWSFG